MDKRVTITIPRPARNIAVGKILALVISGCLFGYWFSLKSEADFRKGQKLTLKEYTATYEQYKADLLSPGPIPMVGGIFLMIVVLAIFFGLYELVGFLLGLMIGKIINFSDSRSDSSSEPLE